MQAGNDTDVRRTVILVHDLWRMMFGLEPDGFVATAPETRIDACRQRTHASLEVLILIERGARRSGDLHEHQTADEFRVQLEQPLDRVEALDDAFGVIHTVDAYGEQYIVGQLLYAQHLGAA